MKICQVVEFGCTSDESYEYIRGTYVSKENALVYMESLENERDECIKSLAEQVDLCSQCVKLFENVETKQQFKTAKESAIEKCNHANNFKLDEDCYSFVYCGYFGEFKYDLYDGEISNSNYKIIEHDIDDFERENPSIIKDFKL